MAEAKPGRCIFCEALTFLRQRTGEYICSPCLEDRKLAA